MKCLYDYMNYLLMKFSLELMKYFLCANEKWLLARWRQHETFLLLNFGAFENLSSRIGHPLSSLLVLLGFWHRTTWCQRWMPSRCCHVINGRVGAAGGKRGTRPPEGTERTTWNQITKRKSRGPKGPTFYWRPFGPFNFVLCALRALTLCNTHKSLSL